MIVIAAKLTSLVIPSKEATTSYNLKHWPAVLIAMSPAHNDARKVENALKL